MKLRLFHHHDGARVAFREAGVGPALILLHSAGLSHREFEPLVEELSHRFRVVLPDLPLHGDSEDRPTHPYSPAWFAEVMASFCHDVGGSRPIVGGRGAGAEILLDAIGSGQLRPRRVIMLPAGLGRPSGGDRTHRAVRILTRATAVPGIDRAMTRAVPMLVRRSVGTRLSERANPAAEDVVHHAIGGVRGNPSRARSWRRAARAWGRERESDLLAQCALVSAPTLLLWADHDARYPVSVAEQARGVFADAHVRVLTATGALIAYDDPVGVAREIIAFCR